MDRLAQLRTIPTEAFTEEDKQLLRDAWIINWVGGCNLPKWLRTLMTQLFYYLDFEIHDINYWKLEFIKSDKEREIKRKEADFWILKYSWIWPIRAIEKFSLTGLIVKDTLNILSTIAIFTISLIPMLLSPFAYMAVRIGWRNIIKYKWI